MKYNSKSAEVKVRFRIDSWGSLDGHSVHKTTSISNLDLFMVKIQFVFDLWAQRMCLRQSFKKPTDGNIALVFECMSSLMGKSFLNPCVGCRKSLTKLVPKSAGSASYLFTLFVFPNQIRKSHSSKCI
jgi:hypothetical protein